MNCTVRFKKTHFGRSNGALGMHLCHVIAWSDIRCRLDILFEEAFNAEEQESTESNDANYENIRNFILKLFQPDDEAVVNFGAWFPPMTFEAWDSPNKPWYEQKSVNRRYGGGKRNMKAVLQ